MRGILVALGFLTIIPTNVERLSNHDLKRSMVFFPLIGLFIGSILILIDRSISLFPPLLKSLFIVATLVILTGAIHLDGLSDTIDGFYAGKTREDILRIMRDSKIGVMGVVGVVFVLLFKWASLCEIPLVIKDEAMLIAPTLARWSIVLSAFIAPYAREEDGLGRSFAGKISLPVSFASGLFALLPTLILGIKGILLFLLTCLIVISLIWFIKRRIGGMTGDTLGAICELVEAGVLVITIRI